MNSENRHTNSVPHLCGGIFFNLLLEAGRPSGRARDKLKGIPSGNTVVYVYCALAIVCGAFNWLENERPSEKNGFNAAGLRGGTIERCASDYRRCIKSTGEYVPFTDNAIRSSFKSSYITQKNVLLERMATFIKRCLTEGECVWLVRALIETMQKDRAVDKNTKIAVSYDKSIPVSKLDSAGNIVLLPFLLDVLHYVLLNCPDCESGKETFEAWYIQDGPKGRWKFDHENVKIGQGISHISVDTDLIIPEQVYEAETLNGDENPERDENRETEEKPDPEQNVFQIIDETDEVDISRIDFSAYLNAVTKKYDKMKTLLYSDAPHPFNEFYVCNDIERSVISKQRHRTDIIRNATADIFSECGTNFLLITGTGGLGKSMMLRHLLLDSAQHYDENVRIPIFLSLKEFTGDYPDLTTFIYETFDSLGAGVSFDEFKSLLKSGRFLLLLDALDEINSRYTDDFRALLENFIDRYPQNTFLLSSRPYSTFIEFDRFTELRLQPFRKEQALELIEKLDFHPDVPSIKDNFRKELDRELYTSHRGFVTNPLLLTIMLMSYAQFAEIPSEMYRFYHEAYVTLAQKHDASKGLRKRPFKTGVDTDRFAVYFGEFCARTYRDEKYEFTEIEFDYYFDMLNEPKKDENKTNAGDFRYDLINNLCLMYYEDNRYHFIHRSFQEYFCAYFYTRKQDRLLYRFARIFDSRGYRRSGDQTLGMLYDMIPERVEESVFEPFLRDVLDDCDKHNGYVSFLLKMYPVLYYATGAAKSWAHNEPESFLYSFIVLVKKLNQYHLINGELMPHDPEFVAEEWVEIEIQDAQGVIQSRIMRLQDVPSYVAHDPDRTVVGHSYELDVKKVYNDPIRYAEAMRILEAPDFPLMVEYNNVREFYQALNQKIQAEQDDIF